MADEDEPVRGGHSGLRDRRALLLTLLPRATNAPARLRPAPRAAGWGQRMR